MKALLLVLAAAAAAAQPYTIAGVVQNPEGHPQKRVRVAVAPVEDRERQTAMITGEDGRFRFDGLPAGKFQVTAEPPSGGRQAFGQRTLATGFGTAVATGPGQHTDSLVFRLIARCAIRGRVTDASGEPAEGVLVQIFVSTLLRGKRSVFYNGYRYTDDRGQYRFGAIGDGHYYLAVAGRPWYAEHLPADAGTLSRMGHLTTYYPGTHDPRSAGLISLKPGQEIAADFTLAAMPAATLTITPGGAAGTVRIDLTFEGIAAARTFANIATAYSPRPALIGGIEPGRYTVRARSTQGGKTRFGVAKVDVGTGDMSADVTLADPPSVTGKLWIEDSHTIPEGAYIELENEVEGIHTRRPVAPDGSFQFESMPPGKYRPLAGTSSKMIHLRSVTLDGTLSTDDTIEIQTDARLELLALLRGGCITGDVVRNGQPVEGALALLAPQKESANPLDYRGFQTDSDGTFDFDSLPPGDYVLIALENWADLEYANPAAVRPYLAPERPVKVEGSSTEKIRIELK